MTPAESVAVRSLLFVAVGIIWYVWPYRRLRIAAYREDLFTIRDELWDYMHRHGFSHNEAAHRRLRELINGLIRLAPMLGMGTVVAAWLTPSPATAKPGLLSSIRKIENDELKGRLYSSLRAVMRRTGSFIFLEGIFGLVCWPIVVVLRLLAKLKHQSPQAEPHVPAAGERMAQNALFVGQAPRRLARELIG